MLEVGERAPEARVWRGPHERVSLADLRAGGKILVFFYLFDWSST
jgi:peroxiredoxin